MLKSGAAANTVAAGNDSRILNALQTTTNMSGDVSGVYNNLSVDKIKGRSISSTAPNAGEALVFDGTQWVPAKGVPIFTSISSNQNFANTTLTDATGLAFNVTAGATYKFKFYVMFTSTSTTTGLTLGLSYPAATIAAASVSIPRGTDGTSAFFQGTINASNDKVVSTASPETGKVLLAFVEGVIQPSASGTVQLRAASRNTSTVAIQAGSFVQVSELP